MDGIADVQKEVNDLLEDQLSHRVEDVEDINEAVGDVARETVQGVKDTANAVEGYIDDSLKDYGRFTNKAAQSSINGLVDAAAATSDLGRDVADTAVRVWQDAGDAFQEYAGNLADNTVQLAKDAGSVWRTVARNAVKALTKYDSSRDDY
ncbi:hypothetical protein FHG87_002941 [Trinorchestia longiramus]|nr:hypothetical protein FHG87_002941 [Trinorchestia longiramus]